ncbi:MAG: HAMP domain-containing histidine kinase [Deltaproteobacteria bacterium]|nr:HAMP domain-containing histidine kinase [Deltaproteobacteria bacterium]
MSTDRPRPRLGLRGKLLAVSLILVFFPLGVVWSVGVYEAIEHRQTEEKVRKAGALLRAKLGQRQLLAAELPKERAWLASFAREKRVMIRVLDASGKVLAHTNPRHGERLSLRGWLRRAADFFFGPAGPPDLLAYEATLVSEKERPEVRSALAGHVGERWRHPDDGSMDIYYRALPIRQGSGVLYLTRLSRRNIRALYDLRYQLLKLTLLLAAAAAAMGLWVGWRLVRPLIKMQQRIHAQMENPAAIDPGALALRRRDEIGELSRDFQRLLATLKGQIEHTGEVAADLAHDLKNPIATVSASAELLDGEGALESSRRERLARAMADASAHMQRSVEGMLDLAQVDRELATAARDREDLGALVARLGDAYGADPKSAELTLRCEAAEGLEVRIASKQIERMLRNVVDNALVFARTEVLLKLTHDEATKEAVLSVDDDGPGVSDGNRDKLFRRFFSWRPEDAMPGTGLGLAISRAIAHAHGGTLTLAEQSPLGGARFVIRLPLLR